MKTEKIFRNLPVLRTKRLILRKITMQDVDAIYGYARLKETTKYMIWAPHKSRFETKKYVSGTLKRYKMGQPASWGIVCRGCDKLIGMAGFTEYSAAHKTGGIGYVLHPDCWGMGYMTEAVKEIINFGFNRLGLNRIEATCDTGNKASARVMEKSGMKFEGIMRKKVIRHGGHVTDAKLYGIVQYKIFQEVTNNV